MGRRGCGLVTQLCPPFVAPWTAARQAPLSKGFSRQEYWSGLPFPPPGDLPNPGIEPVSPALAGRFFITEPAGKPGGGGDKPRAPGILTLLVGTHPSHGDSWER